FNQDAVRVNFPPVFSVESMPTNIKQQLQTYALYASTAESTPTSVTVRRNFTLGEILYGPKEYADLRAFYNKIETKDQESVVLAVAPSTAAKSTTATN
ncbi:MAG TPA: transglutaminase, partial [Edaphobacter sp.]